MGSKTIKMRQSEDRIKQAIVAAHRAGKCDSNGDVLVNNDGLVIPKPSSFTSSSKTYVVRNGKCVEK